MKSVHRWRAAALFLHLLAFGLSLPVDAQTGTSQWTRTFTGAGNDDDYARALVLDPVGNAFVGGNTRSATGDIYGYLAKYAAGTGAVLWQKTLTGPTGGAATTIEAATLDTAGNLVVAGNLNLGFGYDLYVGKFNGSTGALLWERTYNGPSNGNDWAKAVAVDAAGNVFVGGESYSFGNNGDYYTAKFNGATGAQIWEQRYNGSANNTDSIVAIAIDGAGNVVVTGTDATTIYDIYTVKYAAANGAILWAVHTNAASYGYYYADAGGLALDGAGNVVVTGRFVSNATEDDIYTLKYAAGTGAILWERRLSNTWDEAANALALDAAGNVFVTGIAQPAPIYGDNRIFTAKYAAATGAVLWQKYDTAGTTSGGVGVAVDPAGHVVVSGSAYSASSLDYRTLKYAGGDGALLWAASFAGAARADDIPTRVAVDRQGYAVLTGLSTNAARNYDFATQKVADGPYPETLPADQLALNSARLNATVNPNGYATTAAFEYGVNPNLGGATTTAPSNLGSGTAAAALTVTIGSLTPATTYYFRPVATGGGKTPRGSILSFTTLADRTPPVLSPVTISSSNPNGFYAKLGDTITLTFSANEPIQSPTVTIAGRNATVAAGGGNTWKAALTVGATTPQGGVAFTIAATDLAGNAAPVVTATTNGSNVTIDRAPPTLTLLGSNPLTVEGATTYVEPGATASDAIAGSLTAAIQIGGLVNVGVVGTYFRTYSVSDPSGNTASDTRTVHVIDTIPPIITILGANPATAQHGVPYVDAGATASDSLAGLLTAAIQVTSNVNTNVVGTYTVSYSVSDGYNVALASRTVRVVDQPIAGADSLGTLQDTAAVAPAVKLLANDRDPNGHPLAVVSVAARSASDGTVALNAGLITYQPPLGLTGSDSFTYVISDGLGGMATGTVHVLIRRTDSSGMNLVGMTQTQDGYRLTFAGIPGYSYLIQYTNSLAPPVTWTTLNPPGAVQAGPTGIFECEDKPNPKPTSRFYRAVLP
jgi:hypothetical protein